MMRLPHVLPFYVVCDESLSMPNHLDALNAGLAELQRAVGADPGVVDRTRFCLIGFSGAAEVLQPLSPLTEITTLSGLPARAETNFGAAFTVLRHTIERDVASLAGQSRRIRRPAVFFLSDGQPTDPATWPKAYAALTDPGWFARPDMIAFGIGDADPVTIARIGTLRAFTVEDGTAPGTALHAFARAVTTSIVRSGCAHEVRLRIPDRISGFTTAHGDQA